MALTPKLHRPIQNETRVVVPEYYSTKKETILGTIVGIASINVFFQYIVLLDEPLQADRLTTNEPVPRAVVVSGLELVNAADGTDWKIDAA